MITALRDVPKPTVHDLRGPVQSLLQLQYVKNTALKTMDSSRRNVNRTSCLLEESMKLNYQNENRGSQMAGSVIQLFIVGL